MSESPAPAGSYKPVRAPRGLAISCKGWQQEAVLRMFMNSLDPAIAEHPEELIVSSGIGKLARDGQEFDAIVNSLEGLAGDETLLIQSGETRAILKTDPNVPRVLVVNSALPPAAPSALDERPIPPRAARFAADWMFTGPSSALPEAYQVLRAAARKHFGGTLAGRLVVSGGMGGMGGAQALAATLNGAAFLGIDADANRIKRRLKTSYVEVMVNNLDEALRILKNAVRKREPASVGLIANASELIPELASRGVLPDLLTDQTPADDLLAYVPQGLAIAQAAELRARAPHAYREKALASIAAHVGGILGLRKMGSIAFEFGNRIRAQAVARGLLEAAEIPDFISEYLLPDLSQGRGPLTLVALSSDPGDLARMDALVGELFPDSDLQEWIAIARRRPSPGLPARSCWIGPDELIKLGSAINQLVARGDIKAPVVMGRSIPMIQRHTSPSPRTTPGENSPPIAHSLADSPVVSALLRVASGAAWLSIEPGERSAGVTTRTVYLAVVADGKPKTAESIARLFAKDFAAALPILPFPAQNPD